MKLIPSRFPVGKMWKSVLLRTGCCRTFCEEAVLKTMPSAARIGWPPGHFYTSLDSVVISGDNEMVA